MLKLTNNEFKVAALLSSGYTSKEIADKLCRTADTINYRIRAGRERNKLKNSCEFVAQFVLAFGDPRKIISHKDFFKNLTVLLFVFLQGVSLFNTDSEMMRSRTNAKPVKVRRLRKFNE